MKQLLSPKRLNQSSPLRKARKKLSRKNPNHLRLKKSSLRLKNQHWIRKMRRFQPVPNQKRRSNRLRTRKNLLNHRRK